MLQKPAIELFNQGKSTRQIAEALGISKSYAHKLLQKAGLSRSKSEAAILRQPSISKHWRSARQAARKAWQRANGAIPDGYHIHHIDGDHTNNDISNLTCISATEHMRLHHRGPEWDTPRHKRLARKAYMKAYLKKYRQEHNHAS